jgi:hypothetical protein
VKPLTAVTLIIVAYVALAGVALYVAYLLEASGHPLFAMLAIFFAGYALIASGSVKVTTK